MSVPLQLIYLSPQTIRNPYGLEHFVEDLQSAGFRVWDLEVSRGSEILARSDEPNPEVFRIARGSQLLYFSAKRPTGARPNLYFDFRVHVVWGEDLLRGNDRTWVGITSWNGPLVTYPEYDPAYHSRLLLDIGKSIYSILSPAFACIDFGHLPGHTWFDPVEKFQIPHIYWANYFGPGYLRGIGRDKVMKAPAWHLEPLDDGGLLYVLASTPDSREDHVDPQSVMEHFGVDSIR